MKKTLLYSILCVLLLNLWQYARATHQRSQALIVTPAWQSTPATPLASVRNAALATTPPPPAPATTSDSSSTSLTDPAAQAATRLVAAGLKPDHAALYVRVAAATGTPWQLLAAVHKTESGQRGDTAITSYAGAQGPMQFMPATFHAYGADGDGNGTAQITDLDDAMLSAGRYLAANGAARGSYSTALYHYNHSSSYVSQVLSLARRLGL